MIVTGVGSLPHRDPVAAAEFVAATTDLAYLPQLPIRHAEEGMILQWGDGLCGCGPGDEGVGLRHGAAEGPRHEAFVGAEVFLARHRVERVKTQMTGPVTMAAAMRSAGHPVGSLWDCVVAGLRDRLAAHLEMVASWAGDVSVTVVVDEPGLAAIRTGSPFGGDAAAVLRSFFADSTVPLGLHCCAETDWGLVASLRPAVISWDVETLHGGFGGADEALAETIEAGTVVAWGVIPARSGPALGRARAQYGTALARLAMAGAPVERLTDAAWATPACGLAGLTEEGATAVAEQVRAFAGEDGR